MARTTRVSKDAVAMLGPRNVEDMLTAHTDPDKWHLHTAIFLSRCPQLRRLKLGFRNSWKSTDRVFSAIVAKTRLLHLKDLRLDGIRCAGDDLCQLLLLHPGLEILMLENFDTTGSTTFASTMEMLSKTHTSLQQFKAHQIAQNGLRLYLRTLGDIRSRSERRPWCNDDPPDFFDDFERIQGPFKYSWTAEQWEGVPRKIGLMCEDVAVSNLSYQPDYGFGGYRWFN